MQNSAKTVSIRNLHVAVKSALETAKKKYPAIKIEPGDGGGTSNALPLYIRYPWICGYPIYLEAELQAILEFNKTFVSSLASNPAIAALGVDGKFEPAFYVAGNKAVLGFVPSNISVTE
jgi:hypothetical protein